MFGSSTPPLDSPASARTDDAGDRTLESLSAGESATIIRLASHPSRLIRLSSLGLVPGARIRLDQKRPVAVITLGERTLALERAIASEIHVRPDRKPWDPGPG